MRMEKRRQLKCVRPRQLYRNREPEPDPPPFVQVANHVWQLHHDAAGRTPLTGLPLDLRRWRLGEREQGVGKVCIVGAGSCFRCRGDSQRETERLDETKENRRDRDRHSGGDPGRTKSIRATVRLTRFRALLGAPNGHGAHGQREKSGGGMGMRMRLMVMDDAMLHFV